MPRLLPVTTTRRQSIVLLVLAEIAAMSLWFVSSAVLGDISRDITLPPIIAAALASSVPAGFVIGALLLAISGLPDRVDPRLLFSGSAVVAAIANLLLITQADPGWFATCLRFVTGFCLAGVYPVGMKIMVGWGLKDRGWLVGLLVGGLTLGSASPHLLALFGGSNWQLTLILASLASLLAALLVLLVALGPHHGVAAAFSPSAVLVAWTDQRIRRAFGGYLGHMWELYAMWAWIGPAAAASYVLNTDPESANRLAKLTAFCAIGGGALLCPIAGLLADRIGKAQITIVAMSCSAVAALATAFAWGGPNSWFFVCAVLWGLAIIPDSAQFSALIADYASAENAGSLMTLQTALGFALTIVTVQVTPAIAALTGWPLLFALLALGPVAGIVSMLPLRRLT